MRSNHHDVGTPPFLCINETTLFFHNRRFDTPLAKKNATRLVSWAEGLPPPGPVLNHSSKSSRARVVTAPRTKRSLKRIYTERESDIDEPNVPTTVYGGLQDEDDPLEELAQRVRLMAENGL